MHNHILDDNIKVNFIEVGSGDVTGLKWLRIEFNGKLS
jgi:hypothetical protein